MHICIYFSTTTTSATTSTPTANLAQHVHGSPRASSLLSCHDSLLLSGGLLASPTPVKTTAPATPPWAPTPCDCALGWNGTNCQVEVDACHSDPCQNGATAPRCLGLSTCATALWIMNWADCQALKNPCDPNPCSNSGTCSKLSHDTYNCSCVYGWEGDTCQDFIRMLGVFFLFVFL